MHHEGHIAAFFDNIGYRRGLLRVARHGIHRLDELLLASSSVVTTLDSVEEKEDDKLLLEQEEIGDGQIDFVQEYVLLAQILRDGCSTTVSLVGLVHQFAKRLVSRLSNDLTCQN